MTEDTNARGPRGGKTTVSKKGRLRKTFWLDEAENEALRREAFDTRRSETEIVRELLRRRYDLPDP